MKRLIGIVACSAIAAVAACAGETPTGLDITPGGTISTGSGGSADTGGTGGAVPDSQGYSLYLDTVHDGLVNSCSACHSEGIVDAPIFMNENAAPSYEMLLGYPGFLTEPNDSRLVVYGEHTGPGLEGANVDPQLYDNVVAWLNVELDERGLSGGTGAGGTAEPGATFDEAMEEFASCMDFLVWEDMGMGMLAQQQTAGDGPCLGCHQEPGGVGGLVLDADSQLTFQATKKKFNLLKYVTPTYDEDGKFDKLVPSNRLIQKSGAPCLFDDPDDCHPDYVPDTTFIDAVNGFVDHTLDAMANGTCDESYEGAGGGMQ